MANSVHVADIGEKSVTQPFTFACPLHQSGNIDERDGGRDHFLGGKQVTKSFDSRIWNGNDTRIGFDRRERIVGGENARFSEGVEKGRLSYVGKPDDADLETHRRED